MARQQRDIERFEFSEADLSRLVECTTSLAAAEDGWINLVPRIVDVDEKPTSLGFFTLFGGGATGVTMCTWIPARRDRKGRHDPSLGITHVVGRRVAAELRTLAVPIPELWVVEQDHPRRGLVVRVPADDSHEQVLSWAMRAVGVLTAPRPISGWRADVYLPSVA